MNKTAVNAKLLTFLPVFFFFVCLAVQSFSAPISSAADSDYHMTSIWCAWGEKPGLCENRIEESNGPTVEVPFFVQMCEGRPITEWRNCEESNVNPKMQRLRTTSDEARNLYYVVMRTFVSENVTRSILLIRLINSVIASFVLLSILRITRGRLLAAAISGITFVFVPLAFSQLTVATPKSWAVLGAMFAWVFLYAALNRESNARTTKHAWFAYSFCMFLVFASRIDASFFALFSSFVVIFHKQLQTSSRLLAKRFLVAVPVFITLYFVAKQFSRLGGYFRNPFPKTDLPFINYLLWEVTQVVDTSISTFGFGTNQSGGSPGIIGIISFGLFAAFIANSLLNPNRIQVRVLTLYSLFLGFVIYRGNNAIGAQLPGTYILAIPVAITGFMVLLAPEMPSFMQSINRRIVVITLLAIAHTYNLYLNMEFYVRKGIDYGGYFKLSLSGGWWWNSAISPNAVFLIGALAFPSFLWTTWLIVDNQVETTEIPSGVV